jgi:hypothetical protein
MTPSNDVERPTLKQSFDVEVYTPAEVTALAAAASNPQDRAIFLTARSPVCVSASSSRCAAATSTSSARCCAFAGRGREPS